MNFQTWLKEFKETFEEYSGMSFEDYANKVSEEELQETYNNKTEVLDAVSEVIEFLGMDVGK